MKKNKIVNRRMLSSVFEPVETFSILGFIALVLWSTPNMVSAFEDKDPDSKGFIGVMCLLLAAYVATTGAYFYAKKRHANKFASTAAKSYIMQATKEHPEYKDFEEVLSNPNALQDIAAYISNNLRPSERKNVLKVVKKIPEYPTKTELRHAFNDINKIIDVHTKVHPEFDLYEKMSRAHLTHVLQANQNVK